MQKRNAIKMIDNVIVVVIILMIGYGAWRWLDSYGIISRTTVVLPFTIAGEGDSKLSEALATSVRQRLNRIHDIYSSEQERAIAARMTSNLGLGGVLALPSVRTLDATEAVILKPLEFGPISISLNRFLFDLLPKRGTVINGTFERYGEASKISLQQDERLSFFAEGGKSTPLGELVDSTVYQLIAAQWAEPAGVPWPAVRSLTQGFELYLAFNTSSDLTLLPKAIDEFRKAVAGAPAWAAPKLYLAWILYIENQSKAAAEALPSMREASTLFDEIAYNLPDEETAILGRIASIHVHAQIVRSNTARCGEMAVYIDKLVEHLKFIGQRHAKKDDIKRGLTWRLRMAQGNGTTALAQLLEAPECAKVSERLLAGQTHLARAITYLNEAADHFSRITAGTERTSDVHATAAFNLATARFLQAELVLRNGESAANILAAAGHAKAAIIALNFPQKHTYLRGNLAHLYLLEATQATHDQAVLLARLATDQLRKMSFEQRGFPADWARARTIDTLFAQDDWVAGARALLEALDAARVESKAPARSGYWNTAAQQVSGPPVRFQENAKAFGAADFGVPFIPADLAAAALPRLNVLDETNGFGVMPLLVAAALALANPTAAGQITPRALFDKARKHVTDNAHLWFGGDTAMLLDVFEARLLAAEGRAGEAQSRLDRFEIASRAGEIRAGKNAIQCEAVRAYRALGNVGRADELQRALPVDLQAHVF